MLNRTIAALSRASSGRMEAQALLAIDQAEGELRDAYRRVYTRVIGDFAPWSFETVAQLAGKRAGRLPEWVQRLVGIMQQIAGDRISLVTGTLKERVRGVLQGELMQDALSQGFGIDKIVRLLRPHLEEAYTADWQIERLARTEVISSSNFATVSGAERAAEEFDLELEKVWISTLDDRTRESHRAMHEQRREPNEAFSTPDGVLLMYPGDPNGPASEVIQCRCTVGYEPKEL